MRDELQSLNAEVEDHHWWFTGRRSVLAALVREVLPPPDGPWTVLDVGCGTGGNLAALGPEYRAIGFDTSETATRYAAQRFPDLQFICGDSLSDVTHPARAADLFMLTDVLEHVEDDLAMLAEVVGLAKQGAWILITVPAHPELWSEHDVSHGHHRRYTPEALESLWSELEVDVRLHSGFNSRLYPLARAARVVSRVRGRSSGPAGTDLVVPPRRLNDLMRRIFAGERGRIWRALRSGGGGYRDGLSRIALLRRR